MAKEFGESRMDISLAKPPSENKQKEKRRRMDQMQMFMGGYGYDDYYYMPRGPPRGRMMRPPMPGRGGYARGPWRWGGFPAWRPRGRRDYGMAGLALDGPLEGLASC